jgi:hypothetical protein
VLLPAASVSRIVAWLAFDSGKVRGASNIEGLSEQRMRSRANPEPYAPALRVQPWLMTARSGADPRRRRPLPACFVHTAVAIILLDVTVR